MGCAMRTAHGCYPEYHTSADNLEFLNLACLVDSFRTCLVALSVLKHNAVYVNLNPKCEPQLGKRGLYRSVGGQAEGAVDELVLLWVLNLADGQHSLLDIAERAGCPFVAMKLALTRCIHTAYYAKRERNAAARQGLPGSELDCCETRGEECRPMARRRFRMGRDDYRQC